jgi:hypothetical protein
MKRVSGKSGASFMNRKKTARRQFLFYRYKTDRRELMGQRIRSSEDKDSV